MERADGSTDIRCMSESKDHSLDPIDAELAAIDLPDVAETAPPLPPPLQMSGLQPQERARPGAAQRLTLRITLYILGACLFVAVASLVRPDRSVAAAKPDRAPAKLDVVVGEPAGTAAAAGSEQASGPVAPGRNAQGWLLLGTLHGPTHDVWAYASPEGPRYTVIDAMGNVVMEDAAAEDVYRTVPEVDLKNMRLEPGAEGGPLMMVDG